MEIEIRTHNWNEVDINEIAQLILTTRRASPLWRPDQSPDWFRQFIHQRKERFSPSFVILARSGKKLVGMISIITKEPTLYDLWRWHPIVLPGEKENEIATNLIKASIDQMKKTGVARLEVCFDFRKDDLTAEAEAYYQKYYSWYEQSGAVKLDETVYMTCDPSNVIHFPQNSLLNDFAIKPFKLQDKEETYNCFYQAFSAGKDRSILGRTEEQSQLVFDRYFDDPENLNGEASLVLLHKDQVVGFSIFKSRPHIGDEHLVVFCIHPEYQRRGLGKQLLSLSMSKATQRRESLMSVGVDLENTAAFELYKSFGFEPQTKLITHVWEKMT